MGRRKKTEVSSENKKCGPDVENRNLSVSKKPEICQVSLGTVGRKRNVALGSISQSEAEVAA
jgi:hypothetical protein